MRFSVAILCVLISCAFAMPVDQREAAPRNIGCTICTAIVGFAEEKLGSNATLAQIETFLNTTVCHLLPSFLRPECAALVDEYAPEIAQKIFQGFPASVVCKDVGLCGSKKQVIIQQKARAPRNIGCSICTLVVGYAEDKLESNSTLAEIETFLNTTVCHIVPSFLRPECAALMNEYAPQIAQKIFQGFPASVVCKDVGLCPPSAPQVVKPFLMMPLVPLSKVVKPELLVKLVPQAKVVKKELLRKLIR